jgi:tRNA-Thr(GGU) m(6)t(6)A37 methyltransferase TsaA
MDMTLEPIGTVRSLLTDRKTAPKQGTDGAPDAWLLFRPEYADGLTDLAAGQEVILLTWLDRSDRSVLRVRRRREPGVLRGVFSSRSPDRPNPIGLHRVRILEKRGALEFRVGDLEALDGTPILDVKPVLDDRPRRTAGERA